MELQQMKPPFQNALLTELQSLEERKYEDYEFPKVSVVIPTYNCAQKITLTLDSLLDQTYHNFEILIIDGGSIDRSLEIIHSYRDPKIRIYSFTGFDRYEMLNKGINLAEGEYISFLYPGDLLLSPHTLKSMMTYALENEKPHLVYCGTLLVDEKSENKILFRTMTQELLRKGLQPTALQGCWFRHDLFKELGKFNRSYHMRGGLDFFCRLLEKGNYRIAGLKRIWVGYDLYWVTSRDVFLHYLETFKIVWHYYNPVAAFLCLLRYKDASRFLHLWLKRLRVAFVGSSNAP